MARPGAGLRNQHVDWLLATVAGVRVLEADRSVLEVPIVPGSHETTLRVKLPAGFPLSYPELTVSHHIQHPMIDAQGRVASDILSQWDAAQPSGLANIVSFILSTLRSLEEDPQSRSHPSRSESDHDLHSQHSGHQHQPGPADPAAAHAAVQLQAAPAEFPELGGLGADELQGLILDDDAYCAFVAKLGYVRGLEETLRGEQDRNVELAKENLERVQKISDLKNQVAVISGADEPEVRKRFEGLVARQQKLVGQFNPGALLGALRGAAEAVDASSGGLCEAFTEKKGQDVDEFLDEYLPQRTLFHQRDILAKGAAHQLNIG